jgi:hypothetical protein
MPGDDLEFERPGDDLRDEEYPDEDRLDDEATETIACPHCGAEVYQDAAVCPACGTYLTPDTSVWSDRPLWWTLLALVGVVAVLVALAGFLL